MKKIGLLVFNIVISGTSSLAQDTKVAMASTKVAKPTEKKVDQQNHRGSEKAKNKELDKHIDTKIEPQDKQITVKKTKKVKKNSKNKLPEKAYLIDKIDVAIFGAEGTQIVTKSDVDRPSLDGRVRKIDDIVIERLMFLDGQKYKIVPEEDEIDKFLSNIQRENNLTLEDLKNMFKSSGYTYEEGRQQFAMFQVINKILDFKIRSRLIVPEKEVLAYYAHNPEMQEAAFHIQRGVIPYSSAKTRFAQQEEIEAFIRDDVGLIKIDWQEPFWVNVSDLAESKHYITLMEPGRVSMPQAVSEGFEVFRLVEKRTERERPLEERYRDISDILRKPKFEQLMSDYKKQLFDSAAIVHFN